MNKSTIDQVYVKELDTLFDINDIRVPSVGTGDAGKTLSVGSDGTYTLAETSGGPEVLDDLDDVTIGTPEDGDFLLYIGTDSQWENVTPSIVEISDGGGSNYYPDALEDADGNKYGATIMGDQVWMTENLKTTTYMDNQELSYTDDSSTEEESYTYPGETSSNVDEYGYLYNTAAVVGGSLGGSSKGTPSNHRLLPNGWNIPSESDLYTLFGYLDEANSTKAYQPHYTNTELYGFLKPRYAGYVQGKSPKSSDRETKASDGGTLSRINDIDFGTVMYLCSSTYQTAYTKVVSEGVKVMIFQDESGGRKDSSDDDASMEIASMGLSDFYSVRGIYDGTPEEFLEEYNRTHGGGGEATAEGKFLKNLGDNQLAWSDISYNDLKERPFGETCSETRLTVTLDYSPEGYEGPNPSNGVSYGYANLSGIEEPPTKVIINGTVEVELDPDVRRYGNFYYLADIFWDGSSSGTDTGEDWGFNLNGYIYRRLESGGTDMPTLELVYNNCTVKKLDNKYLDLATVATSGDYGDLTGKPTIGAGVLTISQNGVTVGTFSANEASDKTIDFQAVASISSLTDVEIGTLEDGQILQYDETSGKWVNAENNGGTSIIMRTWSNTQA